MKRGYGAGIGIVIGLVVIGVFWWLVQGADFVVLSPNGDVALQQRNLLLFALSLCALVVVPVFLLLAGFAWRYSEKRKGSRYDPSFTHSTKLEAAWWGIPIAIIGVLSVVTFQTSHSLDPYRALESQTKPLEVQVVALQWKWLFLYPDYGMATLNQLVIPEKTPVHFQLTANAPMSGFWIPAMGTQIYAMNGMSSQLNLNARTVGEFQGYSTNINGTGYSDMTFRVHSMSADNFTNFTKHAQDAPLLDVNYYHELSVASVIRAETAYRLQDRTLYSDTILVPGHGHSSGLQNIDMPMHESRGGH